MLQRRCAEDIVNTVEGISYAAVVPDIADVVFDLVIMVMMAHVILLLLITAEDPDLGDVCIQESLQYRIAEGSGATGDEDGLVSEHENTPYIVLA